MIVSYDPKIDEMRQKAATSGNDTSILDAIIDIYTLVNGQLDDANIAPNGITQNNLIAYNWVAPTLLNSWSNYVGSGEYNAAGYMKDSMGFVHLKGLVAGGTIGTNPIFILPIGYRPSKTHIFAVASNAAFGDCYIQADGDVSPNVGNNAWFSLDGITFKAIN